MKSLFTIASILLLTSLSALKAQNVDEIIENYLQKIGGKKVLRNIKGMKMIGKFSDGEFEFPFQQVILNDGRQYFTMSFMGKEVKQRVYDGEVMWSMDIITGTAEVESPEVVANAKLDFNDFPDALLDYKKKGYQAELIGKVIFDERETYKIKVIKENKMFEGQMVEDIVYYYLDVEYGVSLAQEGVVKEGDGKGKTSILKYSDYDLVDNKYFTPFTVIQEVDGVKSFELEVSSIELDPEVDGKEFEFPK